MLLVAVVVVMINLLHIHKVSIIYGYTQSKPKQNAAGLKRHRTRVLRDSTEIQTTPTTATTTTNQNWGHNSRQIFKITEQNSLIPLKDMI